MVSQKTTLDYQKIANLVEQVKADDGEAFAELYSLTYQKFYYFAYMLLQNEQDSQDILQDSYLEILQSIHKLNNNTAFVAWAERIIYHSCMKFKNKQVEIPVEQDELPLPQNDSMSPISQAESKELSQVLFSMILDLDPGFRAVIFMRYVEQFKIAEIAEILECPLGTVKSRIHLAKKQLRRAALASKHKNVLLYTMCFFPLRLSLWKIAAFLPSPAEGAGTSFMEISQAHWGSTLSYKPSGTSSMPQHFSSLIKLAGISCGCAGIVITSAIALNQSNGCIQTIEVSTPYVKTATLSVTLSSPEDVFQLVLSDSSGTVLSAVSPSERSSYHFSILQNGTYTIEARTENSCLYN